MEYSPEETEDQMQMLINELRIQVPEFLTTAGLDAKAMAQRRIEGSGIDATGKKMEDYSEAYAEYRQERGRQIGHVDLNFTGQMWGSTGLISQKNDGAFFVSTIGGRDILTRNKLRGNSDKRGDVLRISREEELAITENFEQQVLNVVNKHLG